jgi:hypothetical protein
MVSKLFEYAVIYHPKVVKDAMGNETQGPDKLLVDPTYVLAADDKQVGMIAARASVLADYLDKLEQVEIVVRPF